MTEVKLKDSNVIPFPGQDLGTTTDITQSNSSNIVPFRASYHKVIEINVTPEDWQQFKNTVAAVKVAQLDPQILVERINKLDPSPTFSTELDLPVNSLNAKSPGDIDEGEDYIRVYVREPRQNIEIPEPQPGDEVGFISAFRKIVQATEIPRGVDLSYGEFYVKKRAQIVPTAQESQNSLADNPYLQIPEEKKVA